MHGHVNRSGSGGGSGQKQTSGSGSDAAVVRARARRKSDHGQIRGLHARLMKRCQQRGADVDAHTDTDIDAMLMRVDGKHCSSCFSY